MSVIAAPEPTTDDLDRIITELETTWPAVLTIRRQSREDVGYREIYVSLDDAPIGMLSYGDVLTRQIAPGAHQLHAHNTLFTKKVGFTLSGGEHAGFTAVNRSGWGTYSALALIIGFLGAGPVYLTLERDGVGAPSSTRALPRRPL